MENSLSYLQRGLTFTKEVFNLRVNSLNNAASIDTTPNYATSSINKEFDSGRGEVDFSVRVSSATISFTYTTESMTESTI